VSTRDIVLVTIFLITFVSLVSWLGRPGRGTEVGDQALVPDEQSGAPAGAIDSQGPAEIVSSELASLLSPRRDRGYPWDLIVVHHSGGDRGDATSISTSPRTPHFVIGNGAGMKMGEIVPTELWQEQRPGSHAGAAAIDRRAIGITLVGNYSRREPPLLQLDSARRLVTALRQRLEIPPGNVLRHDELGAMATLCPGKIPVTGLARGEAR